MKQLYFIILSLIFFYGSSLAQVTRRGDIDGETWTADDSLYIITGDIKVIELRIEPGVIIQFDDNHKFEVDGILQAEGFHSDSIYFQPHPDNTDGWEGIKFKNSSTSSSLKYCRIEGSTDHGINIDQVQPEISNCRIVGSTESGIFIDGTNLQLQHCIIHNNALNGIETDDSQVTVLNSIISENGESGILSTNNNDIINVTNVVIADNQEIGIDCPGGDLTVRNSIIYYNSVQIDSEDGNTNVTYSDVQGASVFPGLGNINAIPDFLERRYYTLSSQSPRSECIDAGNPNFAYTDVFFPPSLGTSRNDMGAYGGPQAFGWYPPLYIKPQIFDFNRVTQDTSRSTVLNILNYRDGEITVSEILFDDDDNNVFSNNPNSFSVEISDSVDLSVTFTPESERGYNSDLILLTESHGTVSIPLSGEGVLPHINLPSSELNFGPIQLGEDGQLEIPITNLGGDTLHVQVTPPSLSNFALDKSQFAINPDLETETVTVTFTPDSPNAYEDSVLIVSNDRDRPEITVSLSGLGLGPVIELGQQTLDFDSVAVLSDSVLLLNIRNNGNDILRINNLTIEPSNTGFAFTDAPITFPLLVEPGNSIDLSIQFNPIERGPKSALLSVYSNDPFQNMLTADLMGTGLAPLLLLSSSEIEFDSVPLTSDSTINLTIFNLGNDLLHLDSLYILPSDDVFKMTDTTISFPYTMETETNVTFPIRFEPIERGIRNAQITLISNDPFQDTVLIDVSGEGVAAGLNLSTFTLSFGTVPIDSDSVQNLIIYNTLETGLYIDSILIDSENSVFMYADTTFVFPQVIDAEDSLIFPVRFRPNQEDSISTDLRIFSDDPFQREVSVQLTGRGIDTSPKPSIVLSSTFLEFNEVDTSSYSQKDLYIYNLGFADLIIPRDSIYITSSAYDAFSLVDLTNNMTIAPGDSQEVVIRFEPAELGPDQANLWIKSNDPLNETMLVMLSGTGIRNSSATISFDQLNSTNPFINRQPATISFEISSFTPIDSAVIFVRRGGDISFIPFSLQKQSETSIWSADIESNLITERGVEYYVRVNQSYTVSIYPQDGEIHPQTVSVQIPYLTFPDDIPAKTYQMISVPFNTPGQTLNDLFIDNLGPYNDSNYRIFECSNGTEYAEIREMNKPLPPGKSVWLISKNRAELDINNGISVSTDEEYTIELQQGWNMISTPFAFPVSWTNIGTGLALRHYDGSDWPFASTMEPFKGYAVNVPKDTVISIPAIEAEMLKSLAKPIISEDEDIWQFQISAESEGLKDQFNYVGIRNSATSGIDRFDYPEPLPIGEYISLYLVSPENDNRLSTDYRRPDADGYIFDIEMLSNTNDNKTIVSHPNNLPDNYDWMVLNSVTKVNHGKNPIHTSLSRANYKLIVGTATFINGNISDYQSLPTEYKLSKNFPNPFNPSTKINYQLPISSEIEIKIYNILGQRVATLLSDKQEAGYYQLEWNGLNQSNQQVSSGIYFLHLQTKQFTQTIKMVLQR